MSTYLLVIIIALTNHGGGAEATVTQIEFRSLNECESAGKALEEKSNRFYRGRDGWRADRSFVWHCAKVQ